MNQKQQKTESDPPQVFGCRRGELEHQERERKRTTGTGSLRSRKRKRIRMTENCHTAQPFNTKQPTVIKVDDYRLAQRQPSTITTQALCFK